MSDPPVTLPGNASPLLISLSLLPAADRDLLRRLAPLTSFDDEIVGELTAGRGPAEAATLASLVRHPYVLKVRGRPGWHRIRDDMRRVLLDSWWDGQPSGTVPPGLAALCEDLARPLAAKPDTDKTDIDKAELVGLRLFVDPHEALGE